MILREGEKGPGHLGGSLNFYGCVSLREVEGYISWRGLRCVGDRERREERRKEEVVKRELQAPPYYILPESALKKRY